MVKVYMVMEEGSCVACGVGGHEDVDHPRIVGREVEVR